MRILSKRSVFGSVAALVIAGFTATALPLVIALVTGSVQVNTLTRQSERTIVESVHATRASEFVADELVSMERNARQYVVVNNEALLRLYRERYSQLLSTLADLSGTDVGAANKDKIDEIKRLAGIVTQALEQQDIDNASIIRPLKNFSLMHKLAGELRDAGDRAMDRDISDLSTRSASMQRAFIFQSIALGSLGVFLAALFISAILRPLRQINQAINRLGAEKFSDEIRVDGPRDLHEIGERLDWLRDRLRQVEQQKNEFVRHMSHELKTPLANIRESTGLLLDNTVGDLNDEQREIVSILDHSGRRLHLLVDNLINLARWREHHAMSPVSFDLVKLVESQVAGHKLLLERKSLEIDIDTPDSLQIEADRERIKTLVANLLSNAIKYSPPQSRIRIRLSREDSQALIEVIDSGPGIAPAEREKVFEPFYQTDTSGKIDGTGIGLSLVQECLQSHGGYGEFVACTSGAHFRAHLPLLTEAPAHA